jgi:tRNA (cmo5U34)-methyltransferase
VGAIVGAIGEYRFTPESYLESVVGEIPLYEELQRRAATATRVVAATNVLDLGIGTGTTSRAVLDFHPGAHLVGIDESEAMLTRAREILPEAELHVRRLEDPLPPGPFDLVVSALAVHHLDSAAKRDLFRRVRDVLRDEGVFVLADVVVPSRREDATTPLTPDFDLPDRAGDQLEWLRDAGFAAKLVWASGDLAVLRARR